MDRKSWTKSNFCTKNKETNSPFTGADLGEILTDFLNERRRCKLIGGSGECSTFKFFGFFYVIQLASIWSVPFSSDEALHFNVESFLLLLKIYLLWKIWSISVKRWKPVWIRAWFNEAAKLLVFTVATSGRRHGIMLISYKNWTFHFWLTSS